MTLRARLIGAFAYALLVVIVALEVPLASNLSKRVRAEVEADSAATAQTIAAAASGRLDDRATLRGIVVRQARRIDGSVTVVDGRGRLLAAAPASSTPGALYAGPDRAELLGALDGRILQDRRAIGGLGPELLLTAVPIVERGATRGAVELAQGTESAAVGVNSDVLALAGLGVLALAVGLGVAWILAGSIARPIRELASVARQMSGGELSARARERGSREQRDLAVSFNQMAERVEALVASQRAFVADASHQLRTPLTGLRLRLESAELKSVDPGAIRDLQAAERETERLGKLVSDLLTLASSEEPRQRADGDVARAARAAIKRWSEPAAAEGMKLLLAGPISMQCACPPADLAVILDNLLENAIKYSPVGESIAVEWEAGDAGVRLAVISGGGPLADAEMTRGFERFYRGYGARKQSGTGLGLAIVAALAGQAGGSSTLRNLDGDRVVAEVVLPVAVSGEGDFAKP